METITNLTLAQKKYSLFTDPDSSLLHHMKDHIAKEKPTFLSSVNPVFRETAQVAFMLSTMINNLTERADNPYRSFLCNAHIEAIHGAIKIARHYHYDKNETSSGKILAYNPDDYFANYFNPMNSADDPLIPGVTFSCEKNLERELIPQNEYCALMVSPAYFEAAKGGLPALSKLCREKDIVFIMDLSRAKKETVIQWTKSNTLTHFDIICWGESLANQQVPFGAFSTHYKIYKPWNNMDNCLLHSSTFGGNNMVVSYVKKTLTQYFPVFKKAHFQKIFTKIDRSHNYKIKIFKTYLNAYSEIIFRSARLDADVVRAKGSALYVQSKSGKIKEKLDCVGGSGCSVRGHNAKDIISDVLEQHDNSIDYWEKLSNKLKSLTGMQRALPGISGASVVEKAMMMALLANEPDKQKVIVFNGNYAGKTLLSINGTDGDHRHFDPLYPNMIYCNPYAGNARAILLKELQKGGVGLIWFENIQGGTLLSVPPEILSIIKKYQSTYDYLIGVDEILNGVYRTGTFVSYEQRGIQPDVTTLSKGLSDMVFPVSAALISEKVYQRAMQRNPEWVQFLEEMYHNRIGSHIAWHVLEQAEKIGLAENVERLSAKIMQKMAPIVKENTMFTSIESEGFHIRLNENMKAFPFKYFKYNEASLITTSALYETGNMFSFFGRIFPPLNITDRDTDRLIEGLTKTLEKPPLYFLLIGIKQYVIKKWATFWTRKNWK